MRKRVLLITTLLTAVLFALMASVAVVSGYGDGGGSGGGGFQEYYIPGNQEQLFNTFDTILHTIDSRRCVADESGTCLAPYDEDDNRSIQGRVSVVAYANVSAVYIDHADDGYDFNVNDPVTADESFVLSKGQTVIFDQFSSADRPAEYFGVNIRPVVGGDRIYTAGGPVCVVRASWPQWVGSSGDENIQGQVLAGYWELYPVGGWGDLYASPLGGLSDPEDDDITYAFIQAAQNDTKVFRNGASLATLGQGQTYVLTDVQVSDLITGTHPIQVGLVASSGYNQYDMRFFSLTPPDLVGNDYWLPVTAMYRTDHGGKGLDLRLYAYAYDDTTLTIENGDGPQESVPLNAGEAHQYFIGNPISPTIRGQVYHVYADQASDRVQLLVAVGVDDASWDWGYPAVASDHYADEYYLAWSPATGPNYPNNQNQWQYLTPGEPVFITPLRDNTELRADWDGDGSNDYFTATLTTAAGTTTFLTNTVVISRFQSLEIMDPDLDNSGGHVYGSAPFAMAWGEAIEAGASDGYDLGYNLLPAPMSFFDPPVVELHKTVSPDLAPAGGILDVYLTLQAYEHGVAHIVLTDTLPSTQFSYLPGTAVIHYADSSLAQVEPEISGQTLSWKLQESYQLPADQTLTIEFQVQVSENYTPAPDTQINRAFAYADFSPPACPFCDPFESHLEDFDFMRVGAYPQGRVSKTLLSAEPVSPGEPVDWEIIIQNTGVMTLATVTLTDTFESAYLSFVSADPEPETAEEEQLIWNNLTSELAPGQSLTVTVHFVAQPDAPDGTTANVAAISDVDENGWPMPAHRDSAEARIADWEGNLGEDEAICIHKPQWITVTGVITLSPSISQAQLQTNWQVVHPQDEAETNCPAEAQPCRNSHYASQWITGNTTFTLRAWWPGVAPREDQVSLLYAVNVLDEDGQPFHNGVAKSYYWYPWVCPPPLPVCTIMYGAHDSGGQDTQLFWLDQETQTAIPLGPLHHNYDIEATAVHPTTDAFYALAGGGGNQDGNLFQVNKLTGELTLIGDTGAHGRDEIVSAAFHPDDGALWVFQENEGLFTVDLDDASMTLQWDVQGAPPGIGDNWEGLAWDLDGTHLYGSQDSDFYRWTDGAVVQLCGDGFLPNPTEALDARPHDGILVGGWNDAPDDELRIFEIDLEACEISATDYDIAYNDVESLACDMDSPWEGDAAPIGPEGGTVVFDTGPQGLGVAVQAPENAILTETVLLHTPLTDMPIPAGHTFAGHAFTLKAYQGAAQLSSLEQPITLHLQQTDTYGVGLYYWDDESQGWLDAACGPYQAGAQQLAVPVCQLGAKFVLTQKIAWLYLPLIMH